MRQALLFLKTPEMLIGTVLLLAVSLSDIAAAQQSARWTIVDSATHNVGYFDLAAADSLHLVATGLAPNFFDTTFVRTSRDGGRTWTVVWADTGRIDTRLVRPIKPLKIAYPTRDMLAIATDSGYIMTSSDGGLTMKRKRVADSGKAFRSLDMLSPMEGIAATVSSVYVTMDGWESWKTLILPPPVGLVTWSTLFDVQMPESGMIFLTRYDSLGLFVMRSVDTGRSWEATTVPRYAPNLTMLDRDHGWAVGIKHDSNSEYNGTDVILRTTNGGEAWETVLFERIYPSWGLYTIRFQDRQFGLAGGPRGKMLASTDGGKTWRKETTGLDTNVYTNITAIAFLTHDVAMAVTAHGEIIRRENYMAAVPRSLVESDNPVWIVPNPASETAELRWSDPRPSSDVRIRISDTAGRIIVDHTTEMSGDRIALRIDDLPSGVYHVSLRSGASVASTILIVE